MMKKHMGLIYGVLYIRHFLETVQDKCTFVAATFQGAHMTERYLTYEN
jgi:hypothetical protein